MKRKLTWAELSIQEVPFIYARIYLVTVLRYIFKLFLLVSYLDM